jgi:hypothetical protein
MSICAELILSRRPIVQIFNWTSVNGGPMPGGRRDEAGPDLPLSQRFRDEIDLRRNQVRQKQKKSFKHQILVKFDCLVVPAI